MQNAGIICYALIWNGNNFVNNSVYFVNNGLQSTSKNRNFLNIIHKMVQFLQQ